MNRWLRLAVLIPMYITFYVASVIRVIVEPIWRVLYSPALPLVVRTPESRCEKERKGLIELIRFGNAVRT